MDVHQCLHHLGGLGANFMLALDLVNAYWQLALHDSSQCRGSSHSSLGRQFLPFATLQFEAELEKVHFCSTGDQISWIHHFCREHKAGERKDANSARIPRPNSVKEIRRFTGLTNYFRAFIPGNAKLAGKLTKLLAKETGC